MHKPSPSRLSLIANIAAAMGITGAIRSTAQVLRNQRGQAPAGRKWVFSGIYIPAGAYCNVEPTKVRNPKIAAHVNMMHEQWRQNRIKSLGESMERLSPLIWS